MQLTVKEIILNYYTAWVENDYTKAKSFISENLKFKSPDDQFNSAESFLNECWQYAELFTAFIIIQEVYSEYDAYIVYKMDKLNVGEFIKTKNGEITEIYVTFNPTV